MTSVQSILPENPVQTINSPTVSKSDNSFQKLLQTKSSSAESDFQDSVEPGESLPELEAVEAEGTSLPAENLIPMAFIPVLEQVQLNTCEPKIIAAVDVLSKDFFSPADKIADISALPVMTEENAAAEPLLNLLTQEAGLEPETTEMVGNAGEILVFQDEEEMPLKQIEVKNDSLNMVKRDSLSADTEVVAENMVDNAVMPDKSGKNIGSVKSKLSDGNFQPQKDTVQSPDKTTDSKSFWENVSSRLTVRKENSEQLSGNMNGQPSLAESNTLNSGSNNKDSTLINDKLNQMFDFTEQDNVLDQIVKKVELDLKSGQTEMRMQLKPENLGEVQMKVVIEDGKLNAHFLTSTATAKEALEANVQQLKQSLQEQGVKVEKIAILLSSGDLQFNQKQQDESLYQNQKITKNWRRSSGIADYESPDETVVGKTSATDQILSAEQIDYRA